MILSSSQLQDPRYEQPLQTEDRSHASAGFGAGKAQEVCTDAFVHKQTRSLGLGLLGTIKLD